MAERSPRGRSMRHPSLVPVLLFFCGAVALYVVCVSHFMVSCLGQVGQAVETTRRVYLPEVVRHQQDAANVERLHRFATVVRYATDSKVRRQAALNVRAMELNASPTRSAKVRVRLAMAARLVGDLARLRQREDELVAAWHGHISRLHRLREHLQQAGGDPDKTLERVARLLDERPPRGALPVPNGIKALAIPESVEGWLQEVEDTQREARLVAEDMRGVWSRCDGMLSALADSIGADACMSLDGLLVDLAQQVHGLQHIASWLLVLTIGVLLALAGFVYRHVVRPVLAYAQAVRSGDNDRIPASPHFRELNDIAGALRGGEEDERDEE